MNDQRKLRCQIMARTPHTCPKCGGTVLGGGGSLTTHMKFCGPERRELFWAQVDKNGPGGCWLWKGWLLNSGYGETTIRCKKITAHRASYIWANGPIPKGKIVLHSCDVPTCVNPEHLSLGTDADNVRDCHAKGRAALGERNRSSKLTAEKVRAIRAEYWGGKRASPSNAVELAAKYGVNRGTIVMVALGRSWTHVQ